MFKQFSQRTAKFSYRWRSLPGIHCERYANLVQTMQIKFGGLQKQHDDYQCPHGGTLSSPRPVVLRPITMKVQIAAKETITAGRWAYLARCGGLLGMRGAPGPLLVGHIVLLPHTDLKRSAFRVACIVRVQNANILFRAGSSNLPIAQKILRMRISCIPSRDHLLGGALRWYPLPLATERATHKNIFPVYEANSR